MAEKYFEPIREKLPWYEHIRKRPGMYLGTVNHRGLMEMLKEAMIYAAKDCAASMISIQLSGGNQLTIRFDNKSTPFKKNWDILDQHNTVTNSWTIYVLNALSTECIIELRDEEQQLVESQTFRKGVLIDKLKANTSAIRKVSFCFRLDLSTWGDDFRWNTTFITHYLREFAYLLSSTRIEIAYQDRDTPVNMIYHFTEGLADRVAVEALHGLTKSRLLIAVNRQFANYRLELALTFRGLWVDQPYFTSYVNYGITPQHGSHVEGFFAGLIQGLEEYVQQNDSNTSYEISQATIQKKLVAAIHLETDNARYAGSVKNKLDNPELVQPIKDYVAALLGKRLEADKEGAEHLLRAFRVRD